MEREKRKKDLIRFLGTVQQLDDSIEGLDENANLVARGLVDSLTKLELIVYLEETYGIDAVDGGFDPDDLNSFAGILDLIERAGR